MVVVMFLGYFFGLGLENLLFQFANFLRHNFLVCVWFRIIDFPWVGFLNQGGQKFEWA